MSLYQKDDPSTIQLMFNSIATRYDKANAILSFQLHKRWNRRLVHQILDRAPTHTFLDLCSGTGDIALAYLHAAQVPCQVHLIDFCSNMLACAQKKLAQTPPQFNIQYTQADVQDLPLSNNTVNCAAMAYGIRNVKDPSKSIQEAFRVLKPGGRFGILELTKPENSILRLGHQLYLRTFLPIMGRWLTANQEAYVYLQNSIQSFIEPSKLEEMMQKSGFIKTSRSSLSGGIATILTGHKP